MGQYRKKPVVIEAVQWTGENVAEVDAFIGDGLEDNDDGAKPGQPISIETLEGVMTAQVGDWIIRGVKGELYPCKPDIFEATYEAVS